MSFPEGILLVNKPKSKTSFYLVSYLRRLTRIRKIGHAGTLDPLATGVMIMLIGQKFTRLTPNLILHDKEYHTRIELGKTTDTFDAEGKIIQTSHYMPSLEEVQSALLSFQGSITQIPPMFSAKKINGQKCYDLARKGLEVERAPKKIQVNIELLSYEYPYLDLKISCSSGTYIRSIAHDLGALLKCGGFVLELTRTRSGPFSLTDCISLDALDENSYPHHIKGVV